MVPHLEISMSQGASRIPDLNLEDRAPTDVTSRIRGLICPW